MVDHDERVTLQEKVDAENAASIQQAQEQAAVEIGEASKAAALEQSEDGVDSDEDPE